MEELQQLVHMLVATKWKDFFHPQKRWKIAHTWDGFSEREVVGMLVRVEFQDEWATKFSPWRPWG
jgi:hypothetical protein